MVSGKVQQTLVPILAMQTQCMTCNYQRTITVLRTCGGSLTDSDASWDLINLMQLPTHCTAACSAVWTPYYTGLCCLYSTAT